MRVIFQIVEAVGDRRQQSLTRDVVKDADELLKAAEHFGGAGGTASLGC